MSGNHEAIRLAKVVPVRFVDRSGNPSSPKAKNPSDAIPVMDVVVRYEPANPPPPKRPEEKLSIALVDTGADMNYATGELVAAIGAPLVSAAEVQGATSAIQSTMHHCHLLFPAAMASISTDVSVTPLRANGRCYDMVIGNLTLRLGKLVMDYRNEEFYWEIQC